MYSLGYFVVFNFQIKWVIKVVIVPNIQKFSVIANAGKPHFICPLGN